MSQPRSEPNETASASLKYVLAGALMGGVAVRAAFAVRAGAARTSSTEVHQAVESLKTSLHGIRQEVQQSVSLAESRLGSKLQTQERAIGDRMSTHYKDLNNRLDTVTAYSTKISSMSRKMDTLETIFVSPRRRGTFGELQLEAIIKDVMHVGSYEFQSTLSNGKRPDCLLHLPSPIGNLAIDSKFPMDAFLELSKQPTNTDTSNSSINGSSDSATAGTRKKLSEHLRKHIRDIADKYIIPGETADCALLFLPSEAIFAEVVEHHAHIVMEAYRARVWIACPTTLMAVVTTMRGVVRGVAISQRADAIVSEVASIVKDVDRMISRSEKVEKGIEMARENLRLMRISIDKVQRRKERLEGLNHETEADELFVSTTRPIKAADQPPANMDDEEEEPKFEQLGPELQKIENSIS